MFGNVSRYGGRNLQKIDINEMEEIQYFQAKESTKDFLDVFVKFTFYIYEIPAT